ncbi:exonuclease domain-containing protein [Glacieibacterium sp.]|uniref:3'-5' exonuclease n=1 Tax=Glacieibacterium sp. TaxID=2860237 RepID=UPI003B00EB6D
MNSVTVRVVDLETTGSRPPAHAVCEIGWQDVTQGEDGRWQVTDSRGSSLVDPGRPIPAVTQAVHHIIDEDVVGAPRWSDIAPTVLRADVVALAAHRASFEQRFCTPALSGGARWICTWKCALRLWPDSPSFSNQVLRYWRKPVGMDRDLGLPVHRALPDAYVTAHHLRDMLAVVSVAQLLEWSEMPGLLPRVVAGPDRGKAWRELNDAILLSWARDRDEDVRYSAQYEIERRGGGGREPPIAPQGQLFG